MRAASAAFAVALAVFVAATAVFVGRVVERFAENQRDQDFAQDHPGTANKLGVEIRAFAGSDFGPAGEAIGLKLDEQHRAVKGNAEAGFKRRLEAHVQSAKRDGFYAHESPGEFCRREPVIPKKIGHKKIGN